MSVFAEEIYSFLVSEGFVCRTEVCCGLEVLWVVVGVETEERGVLPLSLTARTAQEAVLDADRVMGCVSMLKLTGKSRPVIIAEDRWKSRKNMMQSRLLAHLDVFSRIYARNCEVRKIDKNQAGAFLMENHSYGDAKCRYRYGLFLKRHTGRVAAGGKEVEMYKPDTLVAVATFSNARKWKKGEVQVRSYEWTRYASLPGLRVAGGMGKLLNAFIHEVEPDDVMSYADLEWSDGAVYKGLGFKEDGCRSSVGFVVSPSAGWKRIPGDDSEDADVRFFRNSGSLKYRLKLTEY